MCELPSAAIVSNRCWSVMMNKMSGRAFISFGAKRSAVEESRCNSLNLHLGLSRLRSTGQEQLYGNELPVRELATCDAAKCFEIFRGSFFYNFLRQTWRGRSLVPVECLQIIAHELFVETRRTLSNGVLILWPEARRIRCEAFVDQQQLSINGAEFKFGICNDDAALRSVIAAA